MGIDYRRDRALWRYDFQLAGKRYSAACLEEDGTPCLSRRAAEAAERRARIAAENALRRPTPAHAIGYTLAQGFAALVAQCDKASANWDNQQDYIAELGRWFGVETPMAEIRTERIWEYIDWARTQPKRVYIGGRPSKTAPPKPASRLWKVVPGRRADATIDHYLSTFRRTFRIAHKARDALGRRRVEDVPEIPKLDRSEHLPNPVPDASVPDLVANAAPHVAEAALLTVFFGLRQQEAFGATEDQIDEAQRGLRLRAEDTKGKRDEFIPASALAMQFLLRLRDQARVRSTKHLISWRPTSRVGTDAPWMPVRYPKSAIRTALKRAGLLGRYRWHDLKGTFSTGLAHAAPAKVVQQLSRHKDFRTTERYIRVADGAMREAIDLVASRSAVSTIDVTRAVGVVKVLPAPAAESPARTPAQRKRAAGTRRA